MRTTITKATAIERMSRDLQLEIGRWLEIQGHIGDPNWRRWGQPRLAEYLAKKISQQGVELLMRFDPRQSKESQLTSALGCLPKTAIVQDKSKAELKSAIQKLRATKRVDVAPSTMSKGAMQEYLKRKCSREELSEAVGHGKPKPRKAGSVRKGAGTAKPPKTRKSADTFQFDVGISFAGEERRYAESLAGLLKKAGVQVFIDSDHQDVIWGQHLHVVLEKMYRESRFFVPILSRNYRNKAYPTHELQTALSLFVESNRPGGILPLRIDDTDIPGLSKNIAYIDLRTTPLAKVVDLIKRKLQRN